MNFRPLGAPLTHPSTDVAQRFLGSAFDSVKALLDALKNLREDRLRERGDVRGRLPANEEDLLRAALVFAGAGLDATLKRLIRDALPHLLAVSGDAHDKFEAFVAGRLAAGEGTNPKIVARYLASPEPRNRLIDDYIYELTGSSLQSDREVDRVAGALGLNDKVLRQRIASLKSMFLARNEISHELDLQQPERQGDRSRRTRKLQATIDLAHEALEVAQLMVNAAAKALRAAGDF